MPQLHKMNDINDIKMQPGMGVKPGVFQQHLTSGQHSAYSHQQLKQGSAFPVSSPLLLQVTSPRVQQHSSPQFEQQNHLPFKTKLGTPLQYSNSPFVGPTPSPPLSPSPMPGEFEKSIPCVSSISNAPNIGHQQTRVAVAPAQSLAIGILGISASPLLTEFSDPDGVHGNALAATSGKSTVTVQPVEHLINVAKSMSPRTDHCRKTYTKSFIFLSLFVIMTIIGGTFLYNGIEKFQATARDVSDVLVSRANTVADVIHKVLVDLEAAKNVKGCINSKFITSF
ncbi:mediator of RNA polymerase II transcription subunit 15a-like [Cajanus cajan]|uniref:mediator of RNA polymerase II transcription subunit 15a-like n=1 Tax=Cajanus cajan TaxID=3821 RepID=UPI00098DC6AA|nr:mediator of RNA polymerase II transcription subunit 15a-like [Cajanus cajan]